MNRRKVLLEFGLGIMAAGAVSAKPLLAPTPAEIEGPFYPNQLPNDRDADLTRLAGKSGRAMGQVVEIHGRVLNRQGAPIPSGRLEVWQANAAGRYAHANDETAAPLDPNFQGYASIKADSSGRFNLRTVKPGPYQMGADWRAPHLHWKINTERRRLTTQMYFPDESLNSADSLLLRTKNPNSLIARAYGAVNPPGEPSALVFDWNIVMNV